MRSTYHRFARIPALLAGALAALAFSTGAAPTALAARAATVARAASTSTLLIAGAGDGHGVGMSQDGAYGYAKHGWSSQAILAHYYTGTTIGQAPAGAVVRVLIGASVHKVGLERYVRGVVSAEVPSEWPLAALEAQAIASRTYALTAHAGASRFDVYSDTRSQVYRGAAAETAQTNAAVAATAGQIVTYAGHPAITYFFASSGGMTEDVQNAWPGSEPQPWLRGVPDPYDAGSQSRWKLSMSFATAAARLRGLLRGAFRGIEVLRRGYSPRILTAAILGSAGATRVSGGELAERLGLQDTWAYFSVRSGHGPVKPEPEHGGAHAAADTRGRHTVGIGVRARIDGGLRVSGRGWQTPHASAGVLVARRASWVAYDAAERRPQPRQIFWRGPQVPPAPLLIADVPWLLYRAYFGVPRSIVGADGRPVNALLGTVNALLAILEERPPRAVVACFGAEQAAYRVELYQPYHAHREPMPVELAEQWTKAPALLASLGWTVCDAGELEADDAMFSHARNGDRGGRRGAAADRRPRPVPGRR